MPPLPDDELLELWRRNLSGVLGMLLSVGEKDDVGQPVPGDVTQIDPARRQVGAVAALARAAEEVLSAGQDPQTRLDMHLRVALSQSLWMVRSVAVTARRTLPTTGRVETGETAALELVLALEHVAVAGLLRFGTGDDLERLRQVGGEP